MGLKHGLSKASVELKIHKLIKKDIQQTIKFNKAEKENK